MESIFLQYKSSRIHYVVHGRGNRLLVCFHGFGEVAAGFGWLAEQVAEECTTVAIDLPFHGETLWQEGLECRVEDIVEMIDSIAAALGKKNDPWNLLGFSMGGRVALQLLQSCPERTEKIILLAPDGLRMNFWYWLATQTFGGGRLFKFTVTHPGWLFLLLRLGRLTGTVNRSRLKFATYYLSDQMQRDYLYGRWMTMRRFRPDCKKINAVLCRGNTAVRFLFGKYDAVIHAKDARKLTRGIASGGAVVREIEAGHQLLEERYSDPIIESIQN